MPKLLLEIELGNAAMQTAAEVQHAIAIALLNGTVSVLEPLVIGDACIVRDANGNTVGHWFVEADGPSQLAAASLRL